MPCKPAWDVRPVQLFAQHYILHACGRITSDKICVHDTTGAITQLVSVPGAKLCASSLVLDSGTGLMVVSDRVQLWTNEMLEGKSKTHLSGTLHWLTLSKTFTITDHKVTPLRMCAGWVHGCGPMQDTCWSLPTVQQLGKHPKQLHVYDKHQHVLYHVSLPGGIQGPWSAITSTSDIFVVVGNQEVWWMDQQGQVLRRYGQQPGERSGATHIIQYSKGPLLITDWDKHRVVLLSNEATLLQHLSDVEHPSTLHLDEQAGLLFVTQWNDENNINVKVFQLCLKTTRKLCLQDQG